MLIVFRILMFSFALLLPGIASSASLLLLSAGDCCRYQDALREIRSQLTLPLLRFDIKRQGIGSLHQMLAEAGDVVAVIAVGSHAAEFARHHLAALPLFYTMVLNPSEKLQKAPHTAGIVLNRDPDRELNFLQDIQLNPLHIGTICSPEGGCEWALRKLRHAVELRGMSLSVLQRSSVQGLIDDFPDFLADQDAVVLLPDQKGLTVGAFRVIARYARNRRVPLLAPNDLFVHLGALMGIAVDPASMGRQTVALVKQWLEADKDFRFRIYYPAKGKVVVNRKVMAWNGIQLPRHLAIGGAWGDE